MTNVIELKPGQSRAALGLHALVISSKLPPKEGCSMTYHRSGPQYYADTSEHHIEIMLKRAKVWAQVRNLPNVYLRRDQ